MITIIFAPPRYGKTCFLAHTLNEYAFSRDRFLSMKREILAKRNGGFNLSLPPHPVSANFDLTFRKFGFSPRKNRRINPFRLGYANPYVDTHFTAPYEVIGITEAQKYLNSRMSRLYPEWQSRWYEQHGHNNLDIFLDTQRPNLIDVNIRELSRFIEIVNLTTTRDIYGNVSSLRWIIRIIDNSSAYDAYIASGKKNEDFFNELEVVADYNVFSLYDSQNCKPKFYDGHFGQDFDYDVSQAPLDTEEGYIDYLLKNDDELPVGFYSRSKK